MPSDLAISSSAQDAASMLDSGRVDAGVGGPARLIEWFGNWRNSIRGWIGRASVPAAEVDDLTQEVFLKLLRYSNDVTVENPKGYLFAIAMNVVSAWRERARVRMPHDDAGLEELQIEAEHQPENMFERAQAAEEIQAAVDRLSVRQREILLLHVNDGLTYKQIAQRKGLTYRIVLRDLTRAYVELRKQLVANVQDAQVPR